jgi:flagellar biosynthesis protein
MADQPSKPQRLTATALGYDPDNDVAPVVLASGRGKIAEQIIDIAKENNVPIHEDLVLANTLSRINVNQVIPPELYTVVAQVFAYIYRVQKHISNITG